MQWTAVVLWWTKLISVMRDKLAFSIPCEHLLSEAQAKGQPYLLGGNCIFRLLALPTGSYCDVVSSAGVPALSEEADSRS